MTVDDALVVDRDAVAAEFDLLQTGDGFIRAGLVGLFGLLVKRVRIGRDAFAGRIRVGRGRLGRAGAVVLARGVFEVEHGVVLVRFVFADYLRRR